MKASVVLLTVSLFWLGTTAAGAQSERIGGRINDRVGGRINEGTTTPPRGLYGPDPYVGPGSVSPFGQSPVVPLRSAPVQSAPNPYVSRYPSTQPSEQQPLSNKPLLLPRPELPPQDQTPTERTPVGPALQQQPAREQRLNTGARRSLGEGQSSQSHTQGAASEPDRRPLTPRKTAEKPCVNGRTRGKNGDCTGPLRPK